MKKFGAYEILHELKSGGMGSVLLARRRGPGAFEQLVAIKTIRPEFASSPAVRAMFLDEAAILARINHPGIATVHDFGEEGGTLYMVMEYVAGIPFRDFGELHPPPTVIARAIAEACRGLHAAHELRDLSGHPLELVHRDISPDNLMLGFDGHVKVIDFGIALVKKNRQAPVTEFGTVKGKPPYMSPEQVSNEAMDRRSDIWALAVVLWELLTGENLFQGDSIYATALAVQQQLILPPSQVIGQPLPVGLDAAVSNALDRDVTRRTPTAAAFAEQLEQVIQQASGETLEAWAERALAQARTEHRAWLANVVEGTGLPRAVGRSSAQVTEVAPLGQAKTQAAAIAGGGAPIGGATPVPVPAGAPSVPAPAGLAAVAPVVPDAADTGEPERTSIGGTSMDSLSVPPRNKLAPLVILLLALVVAGGAVFMFMHKASTTAGVRDAATDQAPAPVLDAAPAPFPVSDAAPAPLPTPVPDAAIADAPSDASDAPRDGAVRVVTVRHDAGHASPRDAAVAMTKPDAAAAQPAPSGSAPVDIKYKPGGVFANISIDGAPGEPGPIFNRVLSAGRHTIKFLDPKTGAVLDEQTITVQDGKKLVVHQRD